MLLCDRSCILSAFKEADVWPLMTERASQGNRPYSVPAMPYEMMLSESYTLMGLSARSTPRS